MYAPIKAAYRVSFPQSASPPQQRSAHLIGVRRLDGALDGAPETFNPPLQH